MTEALRVPDAKRALLKACCPEQALEGGSANAIINDLPRRVNRVEETSLFSTRLTDSERCKDALMFIEDFPNCSVKWTHEDGYAYRIAAQDSDQGIKATPLLDPSATEPSTQLVTCRHQVTSGSVTRTATIQTSACATCFHRQTISIATESQAGVEGATRKTPWLGANDSAKSPSISKISPTATGTVSVTSCTRPVTKITTSIVSCSLHLTSLRVPPAHESHLQAHVHAPFDPLTNVGRTTDDAMFRELDLTRFEPTPDANTENGSAQDDADKVAMSTDVRTLTSLLTLIYLFLLAHASGFVAPSISRPE
ncbi:hypothetical protein J3R83DRAFT_10100 [Lanmaoa asiatica]|nr:hypothetical protein J3R83DRAFT_10100 [Lanmaoa asiatica]